MKTHTPHVQAHMRAHTQTAFQFLLGLIQDRPCPTNRPSVTRPLAAGESPQSSRISNPDNALQSRWHKAVGQVKTPAPKEGEELAQGHQATGHWRGCVWIKALYPWPTTRGEAGAAGRRASIHRAALPLGRHGSVTRHPCPARRWSANTPRDDGWALASRPDSDAHRFAVGTEPRARTPVAGDKSTAFWALAITLANGLSMSGCHTG